MNESSNRRLATRRSSTALRAALLAASVALLGACTPAHVTVTAPPAASGASPAAASGDHVLGTVVQLSGGGGTGTIQVGKYEALNKCTDASPTSGNRLIGVSVEYVDATGQIAFDAATWSTRDETGARYQPSTGCYAKLLRTGTVPTGGKVLGWLLFQVPTTSQHLWVDDQTADGSTITWQLF